MNDDELRAWQVQWRQDEPDLHVLHRRARREDLRYRLLAVAEYVAGALLLVASLAWAFWRDEREAWLVMAAIWSLALPALAFTLWNRRGLWGSPDQSAQAHLMLARQRCQRALRALFVGYALLAATTLVVLVFAFGLPGDGRDLDGSMLQRLALVVAVYLTVMIFIHRHLLVRRRRLAMLAHDLERS